jgi:hypothetical protein
MRDDQLLVFAVTASVVMTEHMYTVIDKSNILIVRKCACAFDITSDFEVFKKQ